jgi:hypothetical protein
VAQPVTPSVTTSPTARTPNSDFLMTDPPSFAPGLPAS